MPNWVQNRINFEGEITEEEIMSLMTFDDDGDELELDFNKIVPRPADLEVEKSSWLYDGIAFKEGKLSLKELTDKYKDNTDAVINLGNKAMKNLKKYGFTDWYDWSLVKWGCKWSASNTYLSQDKKTITFETPWSPCFPIIKALAKMFPKTKITYEFAEEQTGYYTGILVIDNGEVVKDNIDEAHSKEAFERYFDLWGEDDSFEYNERLGTYEYKN